MARLDFTIEIAAPIDRVGAFFVPQRMPYWYGVEMESCFEVQGGAADFRAGQKMHISGKLGRREVSLTAVVTEYREQRVLEWRFQDAYGVRGLQRWELEPFPIPSRRDAGRTRVRLRDEYELPSRFGRVFDWLITRHAVARRDRGDLARLKTLAERAKFA